MFRARWSERVHILELTHRWWWGGITKRLLLSFEDAAKLEWLRGAAKKGFEATERGDVVSLESDEEIDEFVDQIRKEVREGREPHSTAALDSLKLI